MNKYQNIWRDLDRKTQLHLIGSTYMWSFIILGSLVNIFPPIIIGLIMVLLATIAIAHIQKINNLYN